MTAKADKTADKKMRLDVDPAQQPFILTAIMPPDLYSHANQLRQDHFPPERNFLKAHVTLFHAIPRQCEGELRRLLASLVKEHAPPAGRLEGIMSLGRGTALRLASPDLLDIRAHIAEHLHGLLTAQDQHTPRLHVTIQNKVSPAQAKALQTQLAGTIEPRAIHFPGLALHIYRGGPWEAVREWKFRR